MLLDPVVNIYPPAGGTPGWLTGIIAVISALAGGALAMYGQYRADQRRADREDRLRDEDHKREDTRQWDKDVVRIASEMIALVRQQRANAWVYQHYFYMNDDSGEKDGAHEQLRTALSQIEILLAQLKLIAPELGAAASEFGAKIEEIFEGIWQDFDGEGYGDYVDYRQAKEIPEVIDALAVAVNRALRLPVEQQVKEKGAPEDASPESS